MSDYWLRRAAARQRGYDRDANKAAARINTAYNRAASQIKRDVRKIFEDFRDMYDLTTEEARDILNGKAPPGVLEDLQRQAANLPDGPERRRAQARLAGPAYADRINRREAMHESARLAMANVAGREVKEDEKCLTDGHKKNYMHRVYEIQRDVNVMFPVAGVDEQRLRRTLYDRWSGEDFKQRVWKNTDRTSDLVCTGIEEMLMDGKTSDETFNEIVDNAIDGGKNSANRLLRTEFNRIVGESDKEAYEDCGIEKYRYVAVLDGRTSEACRKLDGQVFPVKDQQIGKNMHPMHPYCRSTTEPVFDYLSRENQTRWARDPVTGKQTKVPKDMTYNEWQKKLEETYGGPEAMRQAIRERERKAKKKRR